MDVGCIRNISHVDSRMNGQRHCSCSSGALAMVVFLVLIVNNGTRDLAAVRNSWKRPSVSMLIVLGALIDSSPIYFIDSARARQMISTLNLHVFPILLLAY